MQQPNLPVLVPRAIDKDGFPTRGTTYMVWDDRPFPPASGYLARFRPETRSFWVEGIDVTAQVTHWYEAVPAETRPAGPDFGPTKGYDMHNVRDAYEYAQANPGVSWSQWFEENYAM